MGRGLSGWGLFGRGLVLGPRAGLVGGKAGLGEELIPGAWRGGPGAGLAQGSDSAPSLVTRFCFRAE